MKVFYSALFLILLHGMAYAQCENFALTVNDVQPPACPNAGDGAITLSVSGAQGMVSYTWSEAGLSGSSVSGLAPGTYSVTATDESGCAAAETVMLEAALVADAGPDVAAYCGTGPLSLGGVANTQIYFSSDITPIEFSDSNQELVPFRGISGEVGFTPAPDSFDPASSDSLYVEIGSATASEGDVVCLPVKVYNFTDIVGAAFTINYDFAHLNFIEVTGLNPNLPGFTETANIATPNTDGIDAGYIILNYFELSLSGVSLSDGSTLFTLCFEVVGISGTSAGPNITYQWTGPNNFTTSELFPQVTEPGVYTLRVTDTSQPDCWAEDEVEAAFQPDSIGVVLTDTITPCHSQPVLLEPEITGGQQPLSFLWSTGDTTPSITVISIDTPADYSVTITSADGCTGLATARVEAENVNPPFVTAPNQPFCLGQPVLLTATASGGTAPYTYIWNDGFTTTNTGRVITPDASTAFWAFAVDANGCSSFRPDTAYVFQQPESQVDIGQDQYICPGEQVFLMPTVSGASAVSYDWNTGQATADIIVQPSQTTTYGLTITNSFGCFATDEVVIHVDGPIITAAASDCDDNGTPFDPNDDTFTFLAAIIGTPGGSWVSNLGPSGGYGQAITFGPFPVSAGDVTLTVADAFDPNCNNTIVVPAPAPCSVPPACSITATITSAFCADGGTPGNPADDSLLVALLVDGGPGIGWNSNHPGSSDIYGNVDTLAFALADGQFSLHIYDHDDPGCDTTLLIDPVSLCAPPCNLQAIVQEVICNDNGTPADTTDDTFLLDILVTGGSGSGWVEDSSGLSGSYGELFTFGPYPADHGHVGLIFRDAEDSSCWDVFDLYTPVPCTIDCQDDPLVLNFDVVFPACAGGADGQAFAIVEGGAGGYSYEWSNGAATFDNLNLPAGDYGLTVTDVFGCQATGSVTLSEPPPLTLDLAATNVSCRGGSDGEITVFITGGTPPYWYEWSIGVGNQPDLGGLPAGLYTVTVTDINDCSISTQVSITEPSEGLTAVMNIDQQPTCPNSSDGVLSAVASGGEPSYEYAWSTGFAGPTQPGLSPGFYSLTITDINGCSVVESILLEALLTADAGPEQVINCNNPTVSLDGSLSTMGPTIEYVWTGPGGFLSAQLNVTVSEPGFYILDVTDASQPGCSATDTVIVVEDIVFPAIDITPDFVSCDSAVLSLPPFVGMEVTWTLPGGGTSTGPVLGVTESGWYAVSVTDVANGCTSFGEIQVDIDPSDCATLKGRLVRDTLPDCFPAADEPGLQNWLIAIQGGGQVYYAVTQADGYYEQRLPIGDYLVYPLLPNLLWIPCQNNYLASLQAPGEMTVLDIPVLEAEPCPELSVDISMPLLRRCWTRSLYISYCNDGTAPAEDAYVVVTLDDLFTYESATAPLLGQNGNEYTFDVGDLAVNQCSAFVVNVTVSCDALVGQSLCAEAKIFPNAPCFPPSPNWSGASLQVESFCEGGEVQFRVENAGSGDMQQALPCIVIEDGVMLLVAPDSIQLNSGETFTYGFPANGSTYRIEVEQEPFHPGLSMPVAVLEGCGENEQGSFSTGFLNQLALDDADPFIDIECREVVGSYDPNDKHGFPRGYGEEHFIYPGTDIEYLVQFQNTGNDTAFLVVIRDTLSEFLDMASIRPGAASHPYTWDVDSSNILVFTFGNILLPDSTTNLEGSQGFVEFKVAHREGLPLGTVIRNRAGIYFDINAPIITNTTFHTLNRDFIEVVSFTADRSLPELRVEVAPNPLGEWALVRLPGWNGGEGFFELFDVQGKRIREQRFSGAEFRFERNGLQAGLYTFRIVDEQGRAGSGKLVAR